MAIFTNSGDLETADRDAPVKDRELDEVAKTACCMSTLRNRLRTADGDR